MRHNGLTKMATIITRIRNAYSFYRSPRNCTILSFIISRPIFTKGLVRTLSYSFFQNGERNSRMTSCEFSTSSLKKKMVSVREVEKVEEQWKKQFQDTKCFGEAIFVLGPMGAGKTTVIENEFRSNPIFTNYAYVDTDEIMGILPYFASDKVEEYYPIAREIAIRLTDWILDQKISFIAEGTCVKYMELIDYIQRLKTGGYTIRIKRLPKVPLEVVLERSKHRRNRLIPGHVVESIYVGSNEGLDKLYEYNKTTTLFEDIDELNENGLLDKPINSKNDLHYEHY